MTTHISVQVDNDSNLLYVHTHSEVQGRKCCFLTESFPIQTDWRERRWVVFPDEFALVGFLGATSIDENEADRWGMEKEGDDCLPLDVIEAWQEAR